MNEPVDYSGIHHYGALHVIEACLTAAQGDLNGATDLLIARCVTDPILADTINRMGQEILWSDRAENVMRYIEANSKHTNPQGGHPTD